MRLVTTKDDTLGQWLSRELVQPYVTRPKRVRNGGGRTKGAGPVRSAVTGHLRRVGQASVGEVARVTGRSLASARGALARMFADGDVVRTGRGVYALAEV